MRSSECSGAVSALPIAGNWCSFVAKRDDAILGRLSARFESQGDESCDFLSPQPQETADETMRN
jgi:hypothetical protein